MKQETETSLKARLAQAEQNLEHMNREWDALLHDTISLHDQVRGAWGTQSLILTYIRETAVIMQHLGHAQENQVLKTMFADLTSRLNRQREACERTEAGLKSVLVSLEQWKGKVRK